MYKTLCSTVLSSNKIITEEKLHMKTLITRLCKQWKTWLVLINMFKKPVNGSCLILTELNADLMTTMKEKFKIDML